MQVPAQYAMFPAIDATLNGTSAVLLLVGRGFIKRGRMAAHRAVMIAALASSSIFLACYLYYHWHVGSVHFQGQGWSRPVYFSILISHTILAAAIVPMISHHAQPRLARTVRPPPRHRALDVSFVDVRFGHWCDCLLHALSFVRCVRKLFTTETQSHRELRGFLCDSVVKNICQLSD